MENKDNVIEVPVTQPEEQQLDPNLMNLSDVAYMIMVGRTKDGETFFRTVGINDLIHIKGLVDFAQGEVDHEFNTYFNTTKGNPLEDRIKKIEAILEVLAEKLK